tara:strand:+ start:2818 stop:2997 length:180 start_codon:yes stop_codon:yes gene_type:complete
MKYKCKGCGATRELQKATIIVKREKVVTKEAECTCEPGQYMEEVLTKEHEGFPTIKRNE